MKRFYCYKNSLGQFICGDTKQEIAPAGMFRVTMRGNEVSFVNVFNRTIEWAFDVTIISKEDNSKYSDLDEFVAAVGDFFVKPSANSGWQRHDDMQGIMSTVSGGSALDTIAIRDTGSTMLAFGANNNDVAVQIYQFTHRKKLNTPLDGLHLHYFLPTKPNAGDTVIFDYSWIWYNNGDIIPAIADWNTDQKILTFTGNEAQFSTGIVGIIGSMPAPENEQYSSMLRAKVTRLSSGAGSDTYAGSLGIDYFDVHFIAGQQGSIYEYTDSL